MNSAADYKLPPRDSFFENVLSGLKRFSAELSVGAIDSGAHDRVRKQVSGYTWAQAGPAQWTPSPPIAPREPREEKNPQRYIRRTNDGFKQNTKLSLDARPAVDQDLAAKDEAQHQPPVPPVAFTPSAEAIDAAVARLRQSCTQELPSSRKAGQATDSPSKQWRTTRRARTIERVDPQVGASHTAPSPSAPSAPLIPRAPFHPKAPRSRFDMMAINSRLSAGLSPRFSHADRAPTDPVSPRAAPSTYVEMAQSPRRTLQLEPMPPRVQKSTDSSVQNSLSRFPRNIDEFVARAIQLLLNATGQPTLRWRTLDSEADYRQLRPGDFFNHFHNNRILTTKAGLADCLSTYAVSSGVRVESFFPRCYDVAQKSEREDFIFDFRRSAALKIAQLHNRLWHDQQASKASTGYRYNFDLLKATQRVLQRWCFDLDPEHFDDVAEEAANVSREIDESTWDALIVYSDLTQAQLLHGHDDEPVRVRKHRFHRPAGGDVDTGQGQKKRTSADDKGRWRPVDITEWPEFVSHTWVKADDLSFDGGLCHDLLTQLERLWPQWSLQGGWSGRNVWIVKPGTNSKGSGIECMHSLPDLLHHCDRMPNRIVQKYIEKPLLLFSGRKFDIRQWVLVRSVSPLKVFLFSECYLRLCNGMYDLGDLKDRERHISNWQVNKHGRNVVDGAVVSLDDFRGELKELTDEEDFWERRLLPQMKHIVIETLRSADERLTPRADSFELFGFDLMIDEAMKMWLLEVNLSPGCESRTPFLERMLERMSHRLVDVAVLGNEEPDGVLPDWLKICDDNLEGSSVTRLSIDPARPVTADLTIQGTGIKLPKLAHKSESKKKDRDDPKTVQITKESARKEPSLTAKDIRRGTRYVRPHELDDTDEASEVQKSVTLAKGSSSKELRTTAKEIRRGTRYVRASDLNETEQEDVEDAKHGKFVGLAKESTARSPSKTSKEIRRGTRYIRSSDIDDEEVEDAKTGKLVHVDKDSATRSPSMSAKEIRRGTRYVRPSEIDDEDVEDAKNGKQVHVEKDPATTSPSKLAKDIRRGTRYVKSSEIDDEDVEDARNGTLVHVEKESETRSPSKSAKDIRRGTRCVRTSEIDDEDVEDAKKRKLVSVAKEATSPSRSAKDIRRGTQFVKKADLDEFEDDSEGENQANRKMVKVNSSQEVSSCEKISKASKDIRKGTRFISEAEIEEFEKDGYDEDDFEEDSQDHQKMVKILSATQDHEPGHTPRSAKQIRKGTRIVKAEEIDDTLDEDYAQDFEDEDGRSIDGRKMVQMQSDDEDSQSSSPRKSAKHIRKGTRFVSEAEIEEFTKDFNDSNSEDGSEHPKMVKVLTAAEDKIQGRSPKPSKHIRKGTRFISKAEVSEFDSEAYDDDFEDEYEAYGFER